MPTMLESALNPNAFPEPVQAIIRKISKRPAIDDHWERFYIAQIQSVARQFIEDDCSESVHVILTLENYVQLQQYIDRENSALTSLSHYVSRGQLLVLWCKVEPYRDLTINSRQLLEILFKLAVAYALLERLEKPEETNLNEEQKLQFKACLNKSVERLSRQASVIPSELEAEPVIPITNTRSRFGEEVLRILKRDLSRDFEIIKNIPILIRAKMPLKDFWKNIFWVNKSLFKFSLLLPMISVFFSLVEVFYWPTRLFRDFYEIPRQRAEETWYQTIALLVGITFSLCLLLLAPVNAFIGFTNIFLGIPGLIMTASKYFGLAVFMGAPLGLVATLGLIAGVGMYRALNASLLKYFIQISEIDPIDVKRHLRDENDLNFRERLEINPGYTTLVVYPVQIPLQYQVMLSNQDIVELKHDIARLRMSNPPPELQVELDAQYEEHRQDVNNLNPSRTVLFTYKVWEDIVARSMVNVLRTEESAFRPRPN